MASQVVLNLIQTYRYHSFANYGGVPAKAEYCHEAVGSSFVFGSFNFIPVQALRLVLHTISTSAGRYGRYIQPLLSLSIDFYVRVFVRVQVAPIEVKKALAYVSSFFFFVTFNRPTNRKVSTFYICVGCQAYYEQPMGRMVEKVHQPSGNINVLFKTQPGPPVSQKCPECDSALHVMISILSAMEIFYLTIRLLAQCGLEFSMTGILSARCWSIWNATKTYMEHYFE